MKKGFKFQMLTFPHLIMPSIRPGSVKLRRLDVCLFWIRDKDRSSVLGFHLGAFLNIYTLYLF